MIRTSPARSAPFDRLGGFDGIDRGVQRFFVRLAGDGALAPLLPTTGIVDVRWQVQLLLTDRLGGPMAYDGPDPEAVRSRLGIDAGKARLLAEHLLGAFTDAGAAPAAIEELRGVLVRSAEWLGEVPVPPPAPPANDHRALLIAQAERDTALAGVSDRPLFVLDPELTLVHLSADAARGLQAVDGELRRAFGLGAAELPGHSVLRFHPAPSQLQGLLQDSSRLPKETTWCVGHAVWRARLSVVRTEDGRLLGYAIAWRDDSEFHRGESVIRRLRAQAEDLPVPIMYLDPTAEKWFGNAACDHALERLAPYIPHPVNPLDGVPVQLFLPDADERRELFRDPARLPYKSQVKIGPETVAILVSPIRDEEQRYLGPQITWEIVHFTRQAGASAPAVPPAKASLSAPGHIAIAAPDGEAAAALRGEARALESTAADLQTLVRWLDLVADQAEGQGEQPDAAAAPTESGPAGQAEAAILAATVGVRRAAAEATRALTQETRSLTAELQQRIHDSMSRTQLSAETLGRVMTALAGLTELWAAFGESGAPAPAPPTTTDAVAG